MAQLTKTKFLGIVFASLVLAACAGQDTTDEDARAEREADAAAAAQADAYASEQLSGGEVAEEDEDKPVKLENKTVYFDFDESRLRPDTRAKLDRAIDHLKGNDKKLRLEGHCDERGTREYNLALGERRAKAVADYLALNGVGRNRLELISYGEEKPVARGSNEQAWAQNRRVELIVK